MQTCGFSSAPLYLRRHTWLKAPVQGCPTVVCWEVNQFGKLSLYCVLMDMRHPPTPPPTHSLTHPPTDSHRAGPRAYTLCQPLGSTTMTTPHINTQVSNLSWGSRHGCTHSGGCREGDVGTSVCVHLAPSHHLNDCLCICLQGGWCSAHSSSGDCSQGSEQRLSQVSENGAAAQTGRASRRGCEAAGPGVSGDLGGLLGGGEDVWVLEDEALRWRS